MASNLNKIRNGKHIGDGSDRTVVLGFKPKKVELLNVTDGTDFKKLGTMELKKARKEIAAGDKTYVDSITINANGFTIEAAVNIADKEFHYAAFQSESDY